MNFHKWRKIQGHYKSISNENKKISFLLKVSKSLKMKNKETRSKWNRIFSSFIFRISRNNKHFSLFRTSVAFMLPNDDSIEKKESQNVIIKCFFIMYLVFFKHSCRILTKRERKNIFQMY